MSCEKPGFAKIRGFESECRFVGPAAEPKLCRQQSVSPATSNAPRSSFLLQAFLNPGNSIKVLKSRGPSFRRVQSPQRLANREAGNAE